MSILVTGASGFIGQHLVRYLGEVNKGYDIPKRVATCSRRGDTDYNLDLSDSRHVAKLLEIEKPDTIIHLAGMSTTKGGEQEHQMFDSSVKSTHNLLSACKEGTRFIFSSSVVVYGDGIGRAFTEKDMCKPVSLYAATKLCSENLVNVYTSLGKVRGINLRMCATVGTGLTHGIVKDFIAKLRGESPALEIIGDCPGSTKPFCHIDDVLHVINWAIFNDDVGEYNVVPLHSINCEQVAVEVMNGLGIRKPIVWLGESANWKGDNKVIKCSIGKLMKLGRAPLYDSREAIRKAVEEITS